jgi:hypothetical protein
MEPAHATQRCKNAEGIAPMLTSWGDVTSKVGAFLRARGIKRSAATATAVAAIPRDATGTGDDGATAEHSVVNHAVAHGLRILLSAPVYAALPVYRQEATLNTLRYLFHHMRCGVLVCIRDGAVALFQPFANAQYRNEWHSRLRFVSDDNPHTPLEDRVAAYADAKARSNRREKELYLPPDAWWMNGGIICNVQPKDIWGDTHFTELLAMLQAACAYAAAHGESLADCDIFLNKRDYPQLRRDATEPYARFTSGKLEGVCDSTASSRRGDAARSSCSLPSAPLTRECYGVYAPIFSFYTGHEMADIPMPTADDWKAACAEPLATSVRCDAAPTDESPCLEKAVFRGSATGHGVTAATNVRLRLARFANTHPDLIDVGITSLNDTRDRVLPKTAHASAARCTRADDIWIGTPRLAYAHGFATAIESECVPKRAAFMPLHEQCARFAYIVYADGHCAASRYGSLMHTRRPILRVQSEHEADCGHLWMFPGLMGACLMTTASASLVTSSTTRSHSCNTASPFRVYYTDDDATGHGTESVTGALDTNDVDHLVILPDLSNLAHSIQYLRRHPDFARRVAANAKAKAPTRDRIAAYWCRMLQAVAIGDEAGAVTGAHTDVCGQEWFSPCDGRYAALGSTVTPKHTSFTMRM